MPEAAYTDPQFRVLRELFLSNQAVGTIHVARPINPQKLRYAKFRVTTAGTATTATAIVRGGAAGTTAYGTATLGTQTAGAVVNLALDQAIATNDIVNVLTSGGASVDVTIGVTGDPGAEQVVAL